jgi:cobalt-zinc-cadmium efflux system membrane fusion protein
MINPMNKKQLATIAGIVAVGIVLALSILFVKPAGAPVAEHAPPAVHADSVKLSAVQINAAGITLLKAAPQTIHTALTLPGEIRFNEDRTAQVVPLLGGTVQAVAADIGATVKRGQVLAVIASTALSDQRSEMLTAEKRLAVARTTFAREKQLWEEKISAEQDYIGARQAMQEAEIALNNARQKLLALGATRGDAAALSSYDLRAPFDGVVVEKHIALGQSVKADSVLFTVSDLATVWADVAVPASEIDKVRAGATVTVHAGASAAQATGKVAHVGALLGAQTRTATARIVLANPHSAWRPGMFVNVDVDVAPNTSNVAVAVAASALQTVDGKPTVFARVPDGFVARVIKPGRQDAQYVEVVEGLDAGVEYAAANSFIIKAELGKSSDAAH